MGGEIFDERLEYLAGVAVVLAAVRESSSRLSLARNRGGAFDSRDDLRHSIARMVREPLDHLQS